ncbi:MAG: acyl-CoA dehydrogenase [Deltaproteobacteria bacterium RIFCSPLOWO2_12_FULL_40_28]|nr:MAG: acyl-CoA dehydrogenase [Deltaproteobacteria bacterium RIFCSPHIGHO2_02_FULL_40_28]OGQ19482.1 MAG: acyl-CoA dehydrogenase [Deltaproteobacteria bacterium RIFCSPHIGHO2_12_FULL_40_32]OGQ39956.1 MAG: acyl-CoA dehydrogenase [Deltaproteobacteria bacterium RIFCSPLOWO2_02_FULL_40_36]OGQ54370.1 MAG: acyl-CoA dehydrogenase [Deltaproteobacteria bacterium RIFCSPLOWO2_12_FULL_40_28]
MELINQFYGSFLGVSQTISILGTIGVGLILGYLGVPFILWTLVIVVVLLGFGAPLWLLDTFIIVGLLFSIKPLRKFLVSSILMKAMKGFMPKISETERTALNAGVVWIEKDLFSGKPNFKKMLAETYPDLTAEEKAFVDGPVERLCEACDDWQVWQDRELPPKAWDIMKKEKFLGMIIPKKYGGLEFSALAHSAVIMKLASRCIPATVTVMVPNSLGPAELLNHYGTEAQKQKFLPRLAVGEDIPCFALTEPTAGSDAGSLTATGVLFKGDDGKLYIRLNWNKRWITLAAISTVLGVAFKLKDPENFLGKGENVGITCALISAATKGVVIGRQHDPLGVPFYNCPTQGNDVVVLAEEAIIGGTPWAGRGWKMLMESLAAGRGISLPAQSVGGAKLTTRAVSNHAVIRKQFGVSIGQFEGIQEPLAKMGGLTYLMEAARKFVCGALDKGIKPPVITAMAKYTQTELARKIVIDGMDVMGGSGISRGPRNILAHTYIGMPIGITVEGANIMTRTLIIFGQGALRAHPYAYKEVKAMDEKDLGGFDNAFWGHIGHVVRNTFRSCLLSLTRGHLAFSPVGGKTSRYYQKLAWASASFAIMADIAMGTLGGQLKMKEKITGRFADILSWMFFGFSTLRRFEAEGRKKEDLPFVQYSVEYAFEQIQQAFDGIFANMDVPVLGWIFKGPIRLWANCNSIGHRPNDALGQQVAKLVQKSGEQRDRLTDGIFFPKKDGEALKIQEDAFRAIIIAVGIEQKVRKAIKAGKLPKKVPLFQIIEEAVKQNIITTTEKNQLILAEKLRLDAITVDDFSHDEFLGKAAGNKHVALSA